MTVLTLSSVETCITAAFRRFVAGDEGTITVDTTDNDEVKVTCVIHQSQFDCGFPGYTLSADEADDLRHWCTTHPDRRRNVKYGFRDTNSKHPDSVNVTLINYTPLMFNFHVYLS